MKRKLPIGIQTFREIREEGHYYVDKTPFAARLVAQGKHYFLSRPRRFGKSLFVDTLKELFEGNEALFQGLAIHGSWDWGIRYPVVRLDFGMGGFTEPGRVHQRLAAQLDRHERQAGIERRYEMGSERLERLIEELHAQTGQRVVVLVDEYDKPILDALQKPEVAESNRDYLRDVYSVVKTADAHIRFAFFTGVSKFSKVSLFSDLNNLIDITLNPAYSAICGYTDADIDGVFGAELAGLDRQAIRDWYNGYGWLGDERLYNPFDVLLLLFNRKFDAYWFQTATPSFLVNTLVERRILGAAIDDFVTTDAMLSQFEVGNIATEALLFQTGYLTIREVEDDGGRTLYRLGFPNREVRQSLSEHLLTAITPTTSRSVQQGSQLRRLLATDDFEELEALLRSLFSSIPYEWHTNNRIAEFEGYYASVFYSHFAAVGLDVIVEDSTSHGRLDMAVKLNDCVYLFEFKMLEAAGEGAAMAQLHARRYADKYRHAAKRVYLIGIEFSRKTRNLANFAVEAA